MVGSLENQKQHVKVGLKTQKLVQLREMVRKSVIVDKETEVKTTPQLVREANLGLFHATMNLPNASKHCGMTQREMKMTFREFLKYNPPTDPINKPEHTD